MKCVDCDRKNDAIVVYQGDSLCTVCFLKRKASEEGTENKLMGFKP